MLSCLLLLLCTTMGTDSGETVPLADVPMVSIIMDDLGYNLQAGERVLELQQPVTLSILPGRPHSKQLAQLAATQGREVMVHLPMQPVAHMALGTGGLTAKMKREEFMRSVEQSIESVPYARGLNNHMGSLLTTDTSHMNWLMEAIKSQRDNFFFVDSKTSEKSIAWKIAQDHSIPNLSRDVFLDSQRSETRIREQLRALVRIAKRKGYAVAIAHPYEETLNVLAEELPQLSRSGIRFVSINTLVNARQTVPSWLASSSR